MIVEKLGNHALDWETVERATALVNFEVANDHAELSVIGVGQPARALPTRRCVVLALTPASAQTRPPAGGLTNNKAALSPTFLPRRPGWP
jgi:hypothetical protein